jgi:hypothetical protein
VGARAVQRLIRDKTTRDRFQIQVRQLGMAVEVEPVVVQSVRVRQVVHLLNALAIERLKLDVARDHRATAQPTDSRTAAS